MTKAKVALIWRFIYTEPNLKTCACLEHHHCSFSTLQFLQELPFKLIYISTNYISLKEQIGIKQSVTKYQNCSCTLEFIEGNKRRQWKS